MSLHPNEQLIFENYQKKNSDFIMLVFDELAQKIRKNDSEIYHSACDNLKKHGPGAFLLRFSCVEDVFQTEQYPFFWAPMSYYEQLHAERNPSFFENIKNHDPEVRAIVVVTIAATLNTGFTKVIDIKKPKKLEPKMLKSSSQATSLASLILKESWKGCQRCGQDEIKVTCQKCYGARYCSNGCLKKDRVTHLPICDAMRSVRRQSKNGKNSANKP